MTSTVRVRSATRHDGSDIIRCLRSNAADPGLVQLSRHAVELRIQDFLVAMIDGEVQGCAQVYADRDATEIRGVAVRPDAQGCGVGRALMGEAIAEAQRRGSEHVWLATEKPAYFERFGFRRFSKWRLPARVLVRKFFLMFRQPPSSWVPSLAGRAVFMRLQTGEN